MKKYLAVLALVCVFSIGLITPLIGEAEAKSKLRDGQSLRQNESLLSPNGRFMLSMQDDGNLVVYRLKPVWKSNTANRGAVRADMQGDGNLVLYNSGNNPVWDSGSAGRRKHVRGRVVLFMQDDGNLVIYKGRKPIWSSKKGVR